jgi:hypothetical protein
MRGLVALLLLAAAQVPPSSPADLFKRLAARLPLTMVQADKPVNLAGRYTGQTSELQSHVGPFLSGEDLYLFPDGSYVYLQWADIMPKTVYDKGKWAARAGVVELVSDPEITWDPGIDRRHLLVRRTLREREIMLLALPADIDYFEKNAADDPELMLLIVGMARTEVLTEKTSAAVKARLMRETWNPNFFRKR